MISNESGKDLENQNEEKEIIRCTWEPYTWKGQPIHFDGFGPVGKALCPCCRQKNIKVMTNNGFSSGRFYLEEHTMTGSLEICVASGKFVKELKIEEAQQVRKSYPVTVFGSGRAMRNIHSGGHHIDTFI